MARLAQSVERKALNLVVVGSSPSVGVFLILQGHSIPRRAAGLHLDSEEARLISASEGARIT